MKKYYFIIIVLFFLLSCNQNSDNVLSQKEFTNLLVDIHIADGYVVEKALFDKNLKNDSLSYYNSVFKKYNINRTDFDKNIDYYTQDFEKFEKIYSNVVKIIKEKEQFLDSLRVKNNKKKSDSLKIKEEKK